MGLSRTFLLVVLVLGTAGSASFYIHGRWTPVEPVELEPLRLPLPMPSSGFLESRIAEFAVAENGRVEKDPSPSDPKETGGNGVVARRAPHPHRVETTTEGGYLERMASRFVYTRYGRIGSKSLATLMDLRSYEKTTKPEGSRYLGLAIARVEEDSILLTYPGQGELRKPRIELDLEPLGPDAGDPEKEQALWTRHQEMWGNRTRGGSSETSFSRRLAPPSPEETQRRMAARKRYLRKMAEFHRRVRSQDPTLDPRDSPLAPTAEETTRDLLEKARGAGQVDEVGLGERDTEGAPQPK